MSSVTFFKRRSALSEMVNRSGGNTVLAALRGADKATADLQAEGRAILMEAISAVEARSGGLTSPEWLDAVYAAAANVIDVCPPDLPGLHKAVYGLCDLTDRQRRFGRLEPGPVRVHISALRPLSQPEQPEEAVAAILEGLAALQARDISRSTG